MSFHADAVIAETSAFDHPEWIFKLKYDEFRSLGKPTALPHQSPADTRNGKYASGNFFKTLGVQPWIGRLMTDEDNRGGRHLWR